MMLACLEPVTTIANLNDYNRHRASELQVDDSYSYLPSIILPEDAMHLGQLEPWKHLPSGLVLRNSLHKNLPQICKSFFI